MFEYFWDMHYLWDASHLYAIVEVIFTKTTWAEALKYLMSSPTTHDIFFSLNFKEREEFIDELFRRYIANAPSKMTQGMFERVLQSPYCIIGIKGLMESST